LGADGDLMEMLNLQLVTMVFLVLIAIIVVFYGWSISYSRGRKSNAKRKIYACGEDIRPREINIPQASFYRVLIKSMKLNRLKEWHSGHLTRYLLWVFAGMVMLMMYLLLMQVFV